MTSHFWSIQQRSDFCIINLAKKLNYYKPTFRCVQEQLRNIEPMELHLKWAEILGLLGSGQQPVPEQILKCKVLFEKEQMYHLKRLSSSHVVSNPNPETDYLVPFSGLQLDYDFERGLYYPRFQPERAEGVHF